MRKYLLITLGLLAVAVVAVVVVFVYLQFNLGNVVESVVVADPGLR